MSLKELDAIGTPSKAKAVAPAKRRRRRIVVGTVSLFAVSLWNMHHIARVLSWTSDEVFLLEKLASVPAQVLADNVIPTNTMDSNASTLALIYPLGMPGGYRNQVIRFISLCIYARQHGLSQLFLPSLLWGTQLDSVGVDVEWQPIPMDMVFDIDHWNSFDALPKLVSTMDQYDCWSPGVDIPSLDPLRRKALAQGSLSPISNTTIGYINRTLKVKRKLDLYPAVEHCRHPVAYGSGPAFGRLWNDYMRFRKNRTSHGAIPYQMDQWVYQGLKPARRWREVAEECLADHDNYVVVHARVELEMFQHACGQDMEKNLEKVLQRVQGLDIPENVTGLMVAVSRAGMEIKGNKLYKRFRRHADANLETLNRYVGNETTPGEKLGQLEVFECGERLLQDFYDENPDVMDHGSLLQSVVNFHLAVHSDIFVGVRGSSYSTDVWTTRYYLGKGKTNYHYTRDGIEPVERSGLPRPHRNCGNPIAEAQQAARKRHEKMEKEAEAIDSEASPEDEEEEPTEERRREIEQARKRRQQMMGMRMMRRRDAMRMTRRTRRIL